MILFPNAKINIGLQVTGKRPDGYHNLDTVFLPIPLKDSLEVVEKKQDDGNECTLHLRGQALDGNPSDNLVVRAYRLLKEEGFELPAVDVWLYKQIPSGAGLGGGSSDAAFMLKMLNTLFHLHIGDDQLERYAARLGADCAVFIRNRAVYATGIGDILTPIDLCLKGYTLVVIKPDIFVSTREAFQGVTPAIPALTLDHKIELPLGEWRDTIVNDFERSIFPIHPTLAQLKEKLYSLGAIYASMSGSGSALYGIYPATDCPAAPSDFKGCFFRKLTL